MATTRPKTAKKTPTRARAKAEVAKPAAKKKATPATKPATKSAAKPATKSAAAKPAKAAAKPAKAPAKPAKAPAAAKPTKAPATAKAPTAAKPAKPAKAPAKPAEAAEAKPTKKPAAKAPVAPSSEAPEAKPAKKAAKAPVEAKPAEAKPTKKAAKAPAEATASAAPARRPAPRKPASGSPLDIAGASRVPPADRPRPARPKSSVLAALEEDYQAPPVEVPPALSADTARSLIARIHDAAHFGDDSLDELPRLLAQIEQIKDPALLPELLGLFEDSDPYGIYWNILYVLENFPDEAYLGALLVALQALHARAPGWAVTCILRVLNTRGDPDDCTLTFERMAKESTAEIRALVVEILESMLRDPEGDLDGAQVSSIELMIKALRDPADPALAGGEGQTSA